MLLVLARVVVADVNVTSQHLARLLSHLNQMISLRNSRNERLLNNDVLASFESGFSILSM